MEIKVHYLFSVTLSAEDRFICGGVAFLAQLFNQQGLTLKDKFHTVEQRAEQTLHRSHRLGPPAKGAKSSTKVAVPILPVKWIPSFSVEGMNREKDVKRGHMGTRGMVTEKPLYQESEREKKDEHERDREPNQFCI